MKDKMIKNNHGWGLAQMLILCAVILIFLGVCIFFVFKLYYSLGKKPVIIDPVLDHSSTNYSSYSSYVEMEQKLEEAGKIYAEENYANELGTDTVMIDIHTLENKGMIPKVTDIKDGNLCEGYVSVKSHTLGFRTKAYISCSHYTSSGYQE